MEKKNTSILIAKIVVLLLCILYVISAVGVIINKPNLKSIIGIVVICLTVYYMFVGYKIPHGNLLKYLFIIVDLTALFYFWDSFTQMEKAFDVYELLLLLQIAIIAYVAGRLNKFKENIALLSIVFIMEVITFSHASVVFNIPADSIMRRINVYNLAIIQLAMIVSYIARYKEHKEAGLADKN